MDKADQILASECEKSRKKFNSLKPYTKALGIIILLILFTIGTWSGLSLLTALPTNGRLIFTTALALWGFVTFIALKLLPQNRITLSLTTSFSMLVLGYLLFSIYKNYGGGN